MRPSHASASLMAPLRPRIRQPHEGAHHVAGPERQEHEEDEHRLPPGGEPGQEVRHRVGDDEGDQSAGERDAQRLQEQAAVERRIHQAGVVADVEVRRGPEDGRLPERHHEHETERCEGEQEQPRDARQQQHDGMTDRLQPDTGFPGFPEHGGDRESAAAGPPTRRCVLARAAVRRCATRRSHAARRCSLRDR